MEQVFTEIKKGVEKEAKQLVSRAKRVADREIQHAKEEAQAVLNSNREITEKLAKLRSEKAAAKIKSEVRKKMLEQQQKFIQETFDAALEKFRELPRDEKYSNWIKALLKTGTAQIPNGNAVIYCNQKDAEIVGKLVCGTPAKASDEYLQILGGLLG